MGKAKKKSFTKFNNQPKPNKKKDKGKKKD